MLETFKKISIFCVAASLTFASLLFVSNGLAATATDAYDRPSSLKTSTAANHHFYITTPSGVAEGETIVVTFPTDFDTSSIVEDDVDIADDSTDLTTAADCSGSEEASVAIAADVLTITICAGDGGAIAAASVIDIEIGLNASASGTGANQITNPSSLGTYFIDVAGTFGDTASIPVPIISDDDGSFSAVVSGGGGSSGGGDPPPPPSNSIEVTSPIGSPTYDVGDSVTIGWASVGSIATVNLYYSIDNGASYNTIALGRTANGSYVWTAPDVSTEEAIILAQATDLVEVIASDTSDTFTIVGTPEEQTVTVTAPNGGESFDAGEATTITWETTGEITSVDLYYSLDNGASYTLIAGAEDDDGSYDWTVPEADSSQVLIRIDAQDGDGVAAEDSSDAAFAIVPTLVESTIAILSPNGGQVLNADDTYTIEWESSENIESVNVLYSTDGGSTYVGIETGLDPTGTYNWTVPNVDTTTALVKVDAQIGGVTEVSDESDAVFSIIASEDEYAITLTQPNGGEEWETETSNLISWSTRGEIDAVDVYFSTDNGLNYYEIIRGAENAGGYLWKTPNVVSDEVLVRVDARSANVVVDSDVSDATFSLLAGEDIEDEDEEDEDEDIEDEDEEEGDEEEEDVTEHSLDVSLRVGRSIDLTSQGGAYTVLPGTTGQVFAFVGGDDVADVRITFADTNFAVTDLGDGTYSASIAFSNATSTLMVTVDFADGETLTETYSIIPTARGVISEIVDNERVPLAGVVVIVYNSDRIQWNGAQYGQPNPLITNSSAALGWYVPNGVYIVTFGKTGYLDSETRVRVRNNILKPSFVLEKEEEDLVIDGEEEDEEEEDRGAVIATVRDVRESVTVAVTQVSETVEAIREVPEVQTAATVAQPVVVASAVGGTVVLASSFSLLPFLQYLLTAPLLFFARRRRQQFGTVYNAFTKLPIDLAIVRLYSEAGKLVKTMVTDQEGRYFFTTDPGFYRIEVVKDGFEFPSESLKDERQDGKYLDVYTGGLIEVTDKTAVIAANIPVEPIQAPQKTTPRKVYLRRFLRLFQRLVGVSGVLLALFVLLIQPSIWTLGVAVFQIVVLGVTLYLIRPVRKKGWGIVYEKMSNNPIRNAIVRLYEPKYNKLLETTITDGRGRYAFLAGPNEYFVTYEKPGFQKSTVSPVDYSDRKEPAFITVDVGMQKAR